MIATIRQKLDAGERLNSAEGLYLLRDADLLEVGALANEVRYRRHPEPLVTYVLDTNLNYTNICNAYCTFCAFYRPHRGGDADPTAYTHSIDAVMQSIGRARDRGCTTVLMQGGINPYLPFDYYPDMVRASLAAYPHVTPHFWSPPEIAGIAEVSNKTFTEVFEALWDAGQRTLPGGGAEVLSDRVRNRISPLKITADVWIGVVRAAHQVGFRGTATMMYGHVETDEDIVEHLDRIRDLQEEHHGFTAFVPWSFSPDNTPLGRELTGRRTGPNRYLRILAVGRLYLDNFEHIDASWFSEGKKAGQVALHFGADDFGGTLLDENVMQEAGHFLRADEEEVQMLIREAGFKPALRNTLYEIQRVIPPPRKVTA